MILRGKAQTFADSVDYLRIVWFTRRGHSASTIAESRGILLGTGWFNRRGSQSGESVLSSWMMESKVHFEATILFCPIGAIVPPSGKTSDPPVNQVLEARSGIEPLQEALQPPPLSLGYRALIS